MFSSGAAQAVNASRPPGRSTRCASHSAWIGSATWWTPKLDTTASKASSANGSTSASPSSKRMPGWSARANAIIAEEKSRPTGNAPRSAAAVATTPGPQARSSTRIPDPTRATSSKFSIKPRVAWAKVET